MTTKKMLITSIFRPAGIWILAIGLSLTMFLPVKTLMADDLSPYKKWTYLASPERTYNHFCATCHGLSGNGEGRFFPTYLKPRPYNFTDKKMMSRLEDIKIERTITFGTAADGAANPCPPWGRILETKKIKQLVEYIKHFSSPNGSLSW